MRYSDVQATMRSMSEWRSRDEASVACSGPAISLLPRRNVPRSCPGRAGGVPAAKSGAAQAGVVTTRSTHHAQ